MAAARDAHAWLCVDLLVLYRMPVLRVAGVDRLCGAIVMPATFGERLRWRVRRELERVRFARVLPFLIAGATTEALIAATEPRPANIASALIIGAAAALCALLAGRPALVRAGAIVALPLVALYWIVAIDVRTPALAFVGIAVGLGGAACFFERLRERVAALAEEAA